MPEDTLTETREPQATPVPDDAADGPAGLNIGLLVLFVVITVLIAVQNLWLRRRAKREAQSGDDGAEPRADG